MSEARAVIALKYFLEGLCMRKYESRVDVETRKDGFISSWTDIVKYLLQYGPRPTKAYNRLNRTTSGHPYTQRRDRETLSCRLNDSVGRCGHVHGFDEVIPLFVEVLNPEIRSLIETYRENHRGTSFLKLIQQARYKRDTIRPQNTTVQTT